MKKFYKMSMKILTACLFLKLGIVKAQLTVIGLGNYNVGAVSDNGVVSLHTSAGAIYKWNASGGLVQIGSISNGYPAAGRTIVSNDGTKISSSVTNAATGFNEISTYDVATATWVNRGGLVPTGWDGSVSSTWGMTANGSTIVGLGFLTAANAHAVKWDEVNGMVDLGSIVQGRSSRANAINASGTVIVGWQDESNGTRSGAKWQDGVESFITDNNGNNVGEAGGISADGSTIIGSANPNPYVWNAVSGLTYITHPNASFSFKGGATGISGDGTKVIGYYRAFGAPPMSGEGFIWTSATGRVNLNDYAVSLGIATNGVTMGLPLAISQDGKKIAGMGVNASNQMVAFYLDTSEYLSVNDEVKEKNNMDIYPNPVTDILYFKGTGKIEKAEIYNLVGQRVKSFNTVEGQIDVSSLSKGAYILEYSVKGEKQQTYKFIKK
ncbi:outer membrane autotransporter barrel domain family protein [Chryseobacterium gleum ATCC 35910]|uniref:Outer membrane autotransporter barrel domain family protein n=2 Tax=Chryseobacterium gleum TaxID=250 RepID=A0ABP2IPX7_CHRGE|nr:outer membrane autotransporter barrel domain family protein [Chryseobacterium gleum ATCC 35910]QQY34092.1 T9SS type A sorting domain-containing protein [Chryseobacterium gleum]